MNRFVNPCAIMEGQRIRETETMVGTKRAYIPPAPDDGYRALVERLWPRGLKKEDLRLDAWLKDVAPSADLRRWFAHDFSRWEEFVARYRRELAGARQQELVRDLAERARRGNVTLVYAARDEEHNSAVLLAQAIQEMVAGARR